ncbi:hypothetical protein LINPERHAP1_LOCUS20278 [Linum perenne]
MYSPFGTKICSSRIAWLGGKVRLMIAECFETHSHGREGLEYQKGSSICATQATPTQKGSSLRTGVKDIISRSGGETDPGRRKSTST